MEVIGSGEEDDDDGGDDEDNNRVEVCREGAERAWELLRVVKKQSGAVGVSVAPVASVSASVPATSAVGALVIDASFFVLCLLNKDFCRGYVLNVTGLLLVLISIGLSFVLVLMLTPVLVYALLLVLAMRLSLSTSVLLPL